MTEEPLRRSARCWSWGPDRPGLATAITAIRNGARALVVERHPGTSIYPRATGVHLRTVELLRSWGLHREVRALDVRVRPLRSVSPTLREATGLPLGYPTDPREVLAVSPVLPVWCPQDRLEPVLLEHLRTLGGEVRFGVELVDLVDDGAGITATLRDRATGAQSSVRARFVVGADGTRSGVRQALGIRMRAARGGRRVRQHGLHREPGRRAGRRRRFGPYVITHPDAAGIIIRVGDNRWFYARQWFPERGQSPAEFTPERCIELIRTAVGDPAVEVRLLTRMPFTMIAEVASTFRVGNGFLVGDAAHRMTPAGALGMNTAIQSAHNLGWKLAWVANGWAGDALLDSYHAERQPAGERNARRFAAAEGRAPARRRVDARPGAAVRLRRDRARRAAPRRVLLRAAGAARLGVGRWTQALAAGPVRRQADAGRRSRRGRLAGRRGGRARAAAGARDQPRAGVRRRPAGAALRPRPRRRGARPPGRPCRLEMHQGCRAGRPVARCHRPDPRPGR